MPQAVSNLAKTYLSLPTYVQVGDVDTMKNRRIVQEVIVMRSQGQKLDRLKAQLRRNHGPTMIFVNARKSVDVLARNLRSAGVRCVDYHGGHSQRAREESLRAFKSRSVSAIICTDVAGRGLDIDGVAQVVNYDMPDGKQAIEKFTHRVGRTGRAGKTGLAVTFLTKDDEAVYEPLANYLRATGSKVPPELAQGGSKKFGGFGRR